MRIATWNLESFRKLTPERESAFLQAMAQVDADVWVLTETWVNFAPRLSYRLAARSWDADDLKPWPNRCWVSIWVRSSISARPLEVRGQLDRLAYALIEVPSKRAIVVAGTVLPWANDQIWPGADGFCAALDAQVAEWERVRGLPDTYTFLVAGDFNQSLPYQQLYGCKKGEVALTNALKKHDLICLTQGKVPLTAQPRIDHLCVSRSSLISPFVPKVGSWPIPSVNEKPITDHPGVFADLDLLNLP